MQINLENEVKNLLKAKEDLNTKITSYFKDKWVLALNYARKHFMRYGDSYPPLKNKNGDFIVFQVKTCRPKGSSIGGETFLDEIVLSGIDQFGTERTVTALRTNTKISMNGILYKDAINRDEYDYDITIFETPEEAKLYAELKETLNPNKDEL